MAWMHLAHSSKSLQDSSLQHRLPAVQACARLQEQVEAFLMRQDQASETHHEASLGQQAQLRLGFQQQPVCLPRAFASPQQHPASARKAAWPLSRSGSAAQGSRHLNPEV